MPHLKPADLAKLSTVVVEDNKFMRGIIGDLLRQMGFQKLNFAADGKEATDVIKTWLPDLVFTDWNMPEMNGLELIKWIRGSGDAPNPEVPIVLITGNNQQQEIMAARDAGVNEFIAKPVTIAAINNRLASTMLEPRKFVYSPTYVGPCRRRRRSGVYKGPLRRLDDPIALNHRSEEQDALIAMIESDIAGLAELNGRLDANNRRQVREVRIRADKTRALSEEASDSELAGSARSLMSYIDAVGATGRLESDIISMHLGAMGQLISLGPDVPDMVREKVVNGLEAVVRKKIKELSSGA